MLCHCSVCSAPPERKPPKYTLVEAAEQRKRVVALREQGSTYRVIGKALGISAQRAHQIYKKETRKGT